MEGGMPGIPGVGIGITWPFGPEAKAKVEVVVVAVDEEDCGVFTDDVATDG